MAEKFAKGFAERGVDVISGMAAGIDGISQAAALKAGGVCKESHCSADI